MSDSGRQHDDLPTIDEVIHVLQNLGLEKHSEAVPYVELAVKFLNSVRSKIEDKVKEVIRYEGPDSSVALLMIGTEELSVSDDALEGICDLFASVLDCNVIALSERLRPELSFVSTTEIEDVDEDTHDLVIDAVQTSKKERN